MDEVTENGGGLAAKQRDVAYAMVHSQKPMDEVLEQFGVSGEEFTGWVLDGRFTEYAASLARGFAEADIPYAWKVLRGMVHAESVSAIRLYFDLVGKKPAANGAERPAGAAELTELRESIFGTVGTAGGAADGAS